nr:MAG TPA: hypothetical protein [Caudoviricetes sp.]
MNCAGNSYACRNKMVSISTTNKTACMESIF